MKIFKRIGFVLLITITLLGLWIAVNSIDDPELSEQAKEMLKPVPEVSAEENGYNDIAYLNTNDFKKVTGVDPQLVRDMYSGKIKDDGKLAALVSNCSCNQLFNAIRVSSEKPHFMLPNINSYLDPLFAYQNMILTWKLLILKARLQSQQGLMDSAIDTLKIASLSAERIRSEERHYFVSYFVGVSGHSFVLNEIHRLASNKILTAQQLKKLSDITHIVAPYPDDGLQGSLSNELQLQEKYIREKTKPSLKKRIEFAKQLANQLKELNISFKQGTNNDVIDVYMFMNAAFPNYYVHPNKTLNILTNEIKKTEDEVANSCKVGFPSLSSHYNFNFTYPQPQLFDIFTPNSFERIELAEMHDFSDYASRRCLYHSYINSVKTVIALQRYKFEHGKLPASLSELVPKYLDQIPIDAFDGEPLRYSLNDKWIYSVGNNYQDNKGSLESTYRGGCSGAFGKITEEEMELCRNNPTVPIDWNDYPTSMH